MARKVFRSKVDWWVWLAIGAALLGVVGAMIAVIAEGAPPAATITVIFTCLIAIAFIASLIFGTSYSVDRGVLTIRCGPFRWKVRLDEIHSVERTRNPLSSPALSLDRIRIRYRKRRSVIISPADEKGFLRAIGHEPESMQ